MGNPPYHDAALEAVDTNNDNLADLKYSELHVEEVAIARLTDEQVFQLSQESLRFKSWTSFRISLYMVVQGFNQAGYGVDVCIQQKFLLNEQLLTSSLYGGLLSAVSMHLNHGTPSLVLAPLASHMQPSTP